MSLYRCLALLAVFSCSYVGSACITANRQVIRLQLTGQGDACRLVMPRAMRGALRGYAGTFGVCDASSFAVAAVRGYEYSGIQAPFAVVGDFNQDGVTDVAMRVRTTERTSLVVVLSAGTAFKLMELKHAPWHAGVALPVLSASPSGAFREVGPNGIVDYVWSEDRFTRNVSEAAVL